MKWALTIARPAGIPVRIHASFLLLVGWVAFVFYQQQGTALSIVDGVVFVLMVFGLVVLHELSHSLTARWFGIGTRDITLWPIGGVSRLERQPRDPFQELVISLAGPLLNFVLAGLIAGGLLLAVGADGFLNTILSESYLATLFWANAILGGFNLLPSFPMDGGRALRAGLSTRLPRVQATRLAAAAGKLMALVFAVAGFFVNPWLILIALFVWIGATAEARQEEMRSVLEGHTVASAMVRDVVPLPAGTPLADARERLRAGLQEDFPVVDEAGRVLGLVDRSELLSVRGGDDLPLRELVEAAGGRDAVVSESTPLIAAVERMQETGGRPLAVVDGEGRLQGLLTPQKLGTYADLRAAGGGRPGAEASREAAREPLVGSGERR